jgi:hypothetical protein
MSTDPSDDIVRLVTAPNPAQAHIWAQGLKQAGVRCKVVGDYLDAGFGDVPGVRAEIWVHRDDVARADDILREMQETGSESDEDD